MKGKRGEYEHGQVGYFIYKNVHVNAEMEENTRRQSSIWKRKTVKRTQKDEHKAMYKKY